MYPWRISDQGGCVQGKGFPKCLHPSQWCLLKLKVDGVCCGAGGETGISVYGENVYRSFLRISPATPSKPKTHSTWERAQGSSSSICHSWGGSCLLVPPQAWQVAFVLICPWIVAERAPIDQKGGVRRNSCSSSCVPLGNVYTWSKGCDSQLT